MPLQAASLQAAGQEASVLTIHEIRLEIGEGVSAIPAKILKKLNADKRVWRTTDWKIVRKSVDARDKKRICFIYTVDFNLSPPDLPRTGRLIERAQKKGVRVALKQNPPTLSLRAYGDLKPVSRPVIAGFGPCGIFAAFVLAKAGFRPIVLERGKPIGERSRDVDRYWEHGTLDPNSNVLFGEGGAGSFSDGKLTTGTSDPRKSFVLETLAAAGAGDHILTDAKPHIGTDVLRKVVKRLRLDIINAGGEIRFNTMLSGIMVDETGVLNSIAVQNFDNSLSENIETDTLILAIGHSARDTYEMLYKSGLQFIQKPFSMGVRIEHPQSMINDSNYGVDFEKLYNMTIKEAGLPPAEYKLSHKTADGRGVYTFCMCPGGEVIAAASEPDGICSNGMSNSTRDGAHANSAVLVDVRVSDFESDHPLAGVEFQRKYEHLAAMAIGKQHTHGTWARDLTSQNFGLLPTEHLSEFCEPGSILRSCLPDFVADSIKEALPVFGRRIKGFDAPDARLYGPETRSSAPLRIPRDESGASNIRGVFPAGEGAGYAGGIMSAAVDGIKAAEAVLYTISNSTDIGYSS
jgi:uncharacterized FAD-dependent dehydrogenase